MSTPRTITGEVSPERDCPSDSSLVRLIYHRNFLLPIGEVWAALTDSEKLGRWYGTYTGDPATGRVRLTMTDDHDSATTYVDVLRCSPPEGFAVDVDGWQLEVVLRQVGKVTTLEFTHRHVPRSEAGEIGPGWQYYLDRLDAALAGTRPPSWDDYLDLVDEYR
ncbi:SRPBCC domain-containing protein [Rhodococcus pyridinivorans]|uniref:SRPBCC domain-containing protein n=1 Tax=Rhodococcus pyridinivorans TaxID=103816 RepID=UPI000E76DE8A|nr:SRPBCC domain-containing protein [Rhodococcus pyridinivorans]WAL48550.1 SRPBCC domain-containing protein [Rhodococcus pyridinivorans]